VREEFDADVRSLRVVILGAGGAARAIASVCEKPRLWSRRERTLEQLRRQMCTAELIVNATPIGLSADDAPLLTRADFRSDQLVLDTIYAPARTKLLDEAAAAGARVANGLSMLLHQGAAAFEIWFNRPAPLAAMRAALR
jgi:shikimate dehydrogenase